VLTIAFQVLPEVSAGLMRGAHWPLAAARGLGDFRFHRHELDL